MTNNWKILQLNWTNKPNGIYEWLGAIWGFDIWVHKIPFMKSLLVANIIIWFLGRNR